MIMNTKKWRIGFAVSLLFALLTAGAGLAVGMTWRAFVAVFCSSAILQLSSYLMKHPVESIEDTTFTPKSDNSGLVPPNDLTKL